MRALEAFSGWRFPPEVVYYGHYRRTKEMELQAQELAASGGLCRSLACRRDGRNGVWEDECAHWRLSVERRSSIWEWRLAWSDGRLTVSDDALAGTLAVSAQGPDGQLAEMLERHSRPRLLTYRLP